MNRITASFVTMFIRWSPGTVLALLLLSCVDPEAVVVHGTNDVLVVDGTITNLAEPMTIRLNRSKADPLTGRAGSRPVTSATVEIIVDSAQVIYAHETTEGSYQLPSDFKGQIGHAYQLHIWLLDKSEYRSTQQVMAPVPPITQARAMFNPRSLGATPLGGFFTAGHDLFIDSQDPADQHNYYRWDWTLYERQYYCRSCSQGVYAVNNILPRVYKYGLYYVSGDTPYEDCFTPINYGDYDQPAFHSEPWTYDYYCRTQCWEIIHNYSLNLFDDVYSNGGLITNRLVGHIPFYQHDPCLVDVRQASLTQDAYRYYKLFAEQTQSTGGLADTPPTLLRGNVRRTTDEHEVVIGYFTASAVSLSHHWLDRRDTEGISYGQTDPAGPHQNLGDDLFYALTLRRPYLEPQPPYFRETPKVYIWGGPPRVPTAVCESSDSRTPAKPAGWQQ